MELCSYSVETYHNKENALNIEQVVTDKQQEGLLSSNKGSASFLQKGRHSFKGVLVETVFIRRGAPSGEHFFDGVRPFEEVRYCRIVVFYSFCL